MSCSFRKIGKNNLWHAEPLDIAFPMVSWENIFWHGKMSMVWSVPISRPATTAWKTKMGLTLATASGDDSWHRHGNTIQPLTNEFQVPLRIRKKVKESEVIESDRKLGRASLSRVVQEGLSTEVTFELRPEWGRQARVERGENILSWRNNSEKP